MVKTRPVLAVGWYLREWMDTLQVRQSDMIRETGWSKTTASLLYNCRQDYNPQLVAEAARALNIQPWELLMPPALAMQQRRLREAVVEEVQIERAAEQRTTFTPAGDDPAERLIPRKAN